MCRVSTESNYIDRDKIFSVKSCLLLFRCALPSSSYVAILLGRQNSNIGEKVNFSRRWKSLLILYSNKFFALLFWCDSFSGGTTVLEICIESMWARNRIGMGLSYRPARLHSLAELIPWNRFWTPKKFKILALYRGPSLLLVAQLWESNWRRPTISYLAIGGLSNNLATPHP